VKKMLKQEHAVGFKEQAAKHVQAVGIVVAAEELGRSNRRWATG